MSNLKSVIGAIILILLVASCKTEQSNIQDVITDSKKNGQFHGAIALIDNDKIILKDSAGLANADDELPNNFNTRFQIASITKLFTGVLILKLSENEILDLDSSVTTYLELYSPNVDKITIRNLLSMESGLPRELKDNEGVVFDSDNRAISFIESAEFEPLQPPGGKYEYSNLGYWLLGAVIEKLTELNIDEALAQLITNQLHMPDTGYGVGNLNDQNYAKGYRIEYQEVERVNYRARYTSGGMYSSMNDLIEFITAIFNGKVLSKESTRLLFNNFKDILGESQIKAYHLSAFLPGNPHHVTIDYEKKQAVLILNNKEIQPLESVSQLAKECLALYNNESFHSLESLQPLGRIKIINRGLPNNDLGRVAGLFIKALNSRSVDSLTVVYNQLVDNEELDDQNKREEAIQSRLSGMMSKVGSWNIIGYQDLGNLGITMLVESSQIESSATMRFVHSKSQQGKYRNPQTDWSPDRKFKYITCVQTINHNMVTSLGKSVKDLLVPLKKMDQSKTQEVLTKLFVSGLRSSSSFRGTARDIIEGTEEYLGSFEPAYFGQLSNSQFLVIVHGQKSAMELQLIIESSTSAPNKLMRITSIFQPKNYNLPICGNVEIN